MINTVDPFGTARTEAQQDTRAAEAEANAALRRLMEEQSKKIAEQELLIGTLQGRVTVLTAEKTAVERARNEERAALHKQLETVRSQRASQLAEVVQRAKTLETGIDTDLAYSQGPYWPVRVGRKVANACRGQTPLRVLQPNDAYPVNTRTVIEVMDKLSAFHSWIGALR
jgi:hypothetical protein